MTFRSFTLIATVGLLTGTSIAGVSTTVTLDTLSEWTKFASEPGMFPATWTTSIAFENFAVKQPLTQGTISGGLGWSSWTASSSVGSVTEGSGHMSTAKAGAALQFNFGKANTSLGGLHGIGGDFGFIDPNGGYQPGRIEVILSNGFTVIQEFTAKSPFAGFWIIDPDVTISGLRLNPLSSGYAVAVDNLYFGFAGVPAPGALALLGVASAFTVGRRRSTNL